MHGVVGDICLVTFVESVLPSLLAPSLVMSKDSPAPPVALAPPPGTGAALAAHTTVRMKNTLRALFAEAISRYGACWLSSPLGRWVFSKISCEGEGRAKFPTYTEWSSSLGYFEAMVEQGTPILSSGFYTGS